MLVSFRVRMESFILTRCAGWNAVPLAAQASDNGGPFLNVRTKTYRLKPVPPETRVKLAGLRDAICRTFRIILRQAACTLWQRRSATLRILRCGRYAC